MTLIKVSCVSYTNSLPFVYGLRNHKISNDIILSLDNPADCATKLRTDIVDIGLIPVAAISSIPDAFQITNWCIGTNGPVQSVTLLSNVPLEDIKKIFLDFQSVTSNLLTRVLALNHWKIHPVFIKGQEGFEEKITGSTAGVVIGDRALQMQHKFRFVYDLAWEWNKFTGLPFVFARWVSNKKPDENFLIQFNDALSFGIENMTTVINELKSGKGYFDGIEDYLTNNLSYSFDALKKQGMEKFLHYAAQFSTPEVRELQ